jgi:hypothetical protein
MKRPSPVITESELWAAVDSARAAVSASTERPPNGFTLSDYAARYGIPDTTAKDQLKRLLRVNKLLVKKCVIGGRVANVYWIP